MHVISEADREGSAWQPAEDAAQNDRGVVSEPWLRLGLHAGCWRGVRSTGERSGRSQVGRRTHAHVGQRRGDRAGGSLGAGPRRDGPRVVTDEGSHVLPRGGFLGRIGATGG